MSDEPKVVVGIKMTPAERAALILLAEREGRTLSSQARIMIRSGLRAEAVPV